MMMDRFWVLAVMIALGIAFSAGCDPQANQRPNAGRADADGRKGQAAEQTAESTGARREATTAEMTLENELECPGGVAVGSSDDYAPGAEGEKESPVEMARRDFSRQIEAGDKVGLVATRYGGSRTVRVVRDGRTMALIDYRHAKGGWLKDSYEACAGF